MCYICLRMEDRQYKDLLRLVWSNRLFDTANAVLSDGCAIEIEKPGMADEGNERGMDFYGASYREKGDGKVFHGSVRVDALSSVWRDSGAMMEKGTDGVLLHVVGEQDRVLIREGQPIPTLVLNVRGELLDFYERMLEDPGQRGEERECVRFFTDLEAVEQNQILGRLMADRLERKEAEVLAIYRSLDEDWEETAYVAFLRSLGMGGKKRSYEALARSLPYRVILQCRGDVQRIEALLMGQSGYLSLIGDAPDAYTRQLQDIYLALKKEYGLKRPVVMWGGRSGGSVRPSSLPPVMLAQAAHLLAREANLFSRIRTCAGERGGVKELREIFRTETSDYWREQHRAAEKRYTRSASFSDQKIDLRLINFVIPLMSAEGAVTGNGTLRDWALGLYDEVAPEENTYIRQWSSAGFRPQNAFDSQAVIQLATEYCAEGLCGRCPVGVSRMVKLWKGMN